MVHRALGPAAYIAHARVVPLRNMGALVSPFNAFLILQGIETLALHGPHLHQRREAWPNGGSPPGGGLGQLRRPARQRQQTLVQIHGRPRLGHHRFGLKSDRGGRRALPWMRSLFTRLVNIGDAKSLATRPATPLPPAERR